MSEEIPPFNLDSAFVLLVHRCSRYLKQVTSDGVSFHRRMACSWWVLSGSKTLDSDQLLRLDFVKFICSVVSSQRRQQAASNDSIRWSSTSVSPVSSSLMNCTLSHCQKHVALLQQSFARWRHFIFQI